ncbi:nitroreductase family protein [Antrihabitans cavernicola]|uniref:Nitroreductase family protein n=1 Tax=Antrihabitans cavernicola TaxID=2495913 RepID=A0A5A7SA67_9NOCA|nr:nitroreductase family protein [Spelaeibacter cavernicola]KAA0021425.1 nitroreductase family protein [Spelaeibacter cavernicola]
MATFPVLDLTPDELLTTTRTVRKRLDLDKPVPLDLIKECLQIALQAPSGSNRQGWQWVVITDPELRAGVGRIYGEQVEKYLNSRASAAKLFADNPDRAPVQQRVGDSVAWLGDRMGDVPVLVIPCIKASADLPAGNQAGLWGSLLPAAWSYALAARVRGLGTAWTTLHLEREAEVSELLGIPTGFHQAALIPTAYYTGESFKVAPREPIDSVLHVDGW